MKTKKDNRFLLGVIVPLIILVLWQLIGLFKILPPQVLPAPNIILKAFGRLIASGTLQKNLLISTQRAAIGFSIGGGLGLALGLIVGFFKKGELMLDPTIQLLRMVPHMAIMPLFILWFGFGELSKVLLVGNGAFFPIYINTYNGIRGVDNRLFEVARVLEFSRIQQVTKVILPAAMPNILTGIRLALGSTWLTLIVAELMGATAGIGYMITDAREFARTDVVFVGIIIFAVVGKLTDSIVRLLENRLLRWRESYAGSGK